MSHEETVNDEDEFKLTPKGTVVAALVSSGMKYSEALDLVDQAITSTRTELIEELNIAYKEQRLYDYALKLFKELPEYSRKEEA